MFGTTLEPQWMVNEGTNLLGPFKKKKMDRINTKQLYCNKQTAFLGRFPFLGQGNCYLYPAGDFKRSTTQE